MGGQKISVGVIFQMVVFFGCGGFFQLQDVLIDPDLLICKGETTDVLDLVALKNNIFQQQGFEHETHNKKRKDLTDDIVGQPELFSFLNNEGSEGNILNQAFGVFDILGMKDAFFQDHFFLLGTDAQIIGQQ
jgi:hypothetical protein